MLKIDKVLLALGMGAFFFDDEEAIKRGAVQDGFIYPGKPLTPGYTAIRMPAEQVLVMFVLSDGQVAYGDCIQQQHSGRAGRDALRPSAEIMETIRTHYVPRLEGRELTSFRSLAAEIDAVRVNGERPHVGIPYGLTQALLDALAKSQRKTMAEVLAGEYHTEVADQPVPLAPQAADDWYLNSDKMILKRAPVMPNPLCRTRKQFEELPEFITWLKDRIARLAGADYQPTFFFDFYGSVGFFLDGDMSKIVGYLARLEETSRPYNLIVEDPIIVNTTKKDQLQAVQGMRAALQRAGLRMKLVADEWVTSFDDIKMYAEAGAMDIYGTHPMDLGGLNNFVEASIFCHEHGVETWLGGTCAGTERSSQMRCHIALATRASFMLPGPGMGVDEAISIAINEMQRTLALIQYRKAREPA
ncbi:MAG: methylaspartate ammonia-lyase [Chloroflexi bacterium]|nr:methylaspartate ammonia-lyase [Chloroflexota bacterium]